MSAISPDAALFAGTHGQQRRIRLKRWDGESWSNLPGLAKPQRDISAMEATGPDDAWAVGSRYTGTTSHYLMSHWDGAQWRLIHDGGSGDKGGSYLDDVSAVAPDDVWVAGFDNNGSLTSIVKHWDGSTWQQVPSPDAFLYAVSALSADDVWVVGEVPFQGWQFMHWDGQEWSTFPADEPQADIVLSLDAVAPNDVWAAGFTWGQTGGTDQTVIEHWDGEAWSVIPSPSPGVQSNWLSDIRGDSATDAWAAGSFSNGHDPNLQKTLLMHWNGSTWTRLHDVR